jgi:YD repeat-containing protein
MGSHNMQAVSSRSPVGLGSWRPRIASYRLGVWPLCCLVSMLAAVSLVSYVPAAYADTIMFKAYAPSVGYGPLYPTPVQADQWAVAQTPGSTVGSVCKYVFMNGAAYMFFNGIPYAGGSFECGAFAVYASCVRSDGSFYGPNTVPQGFLQCQCPTGQVWDQFRNVCTSGFFAKAIVPKSSDFGGRCCAGRPLVADPINPALGNQYRYEGDILPADATGRLSFERFYNSADTGSTALGAGWRHRFSRSIRGVTDALPYVPGIPATSSLYMDPGTACSSGFSEIQSQVPNWQGASASYANGICSLSKSSATIGTLPILTSTIGFSQQLSVTIGYEVVRDDGKVVRFINQGGALMAPAGSGLKLQQTQTGYSLTDENDTVETYNPQRQLLTVTTRSGIATTLTYDSSARLSTVTDSFGHHLTLGYDGQGRLSSVTRR